MQRKSETYKKLYYEKPKVLSLVFIFAIPFKKMSTIYRGYNYVNIIICRCLLQFLKMIYSVDICRVFICNQSVFAHILDALNAVIKNIDGFNS